MSLRSRLLAGLAVVVTAFVIVGVIVIASQRTQLVQQIDERLATVAPLNDSQPRRPVGAEPPNPSPQQRVVDTPLSDLYIATLQPDGSFEVIVQGLLLDTTPELDALPDDVSFDVRTFLQLESEDGAVQFRALVNPAGPAGQQSIIAVPLTDAQDSIRQLTISLVLLGAFVAAVLATLAWWIARLGLRPISTMTATATAIAEGESEQRVPLMDDRTEAGQLAAAFNTMLDQREAADDRLRQFVSDASHELRTPLTSMRGYLDLYTQGGFRKEGQLDDVIGRMQSETNRMSRLAEDLLQLARMDEEFTLQRETVDVADLVSDVVADSRAAHPERRIEMETAAGQVVSLDRNRVEQIVGGLVSNALTHAPDATIRVHSGVSEGVVAISVRDDGPGLDAEQASKVFERFYRGAPNRARTSGGSGLGLAIAKTIAEAHGGTITLDTSPGRGCDFTVRLPVD